MSDLMLDVGQANELKMAFRRALFSGEDIKRLCEGYLMADVLNLVRGTHRLTQVANALVSVGTISVAPTTTKFIASEKFVVNIQASAKVKISHLGGNFKSWFLGKIEAPFSGSELRYLKLLKETRVIPIITELGGEEKSETTLTEMFSLMEKQGDGQQGALLTNGRANTFYIRDLKGVLRVVSVYCGYDALIVCADPVGVRLSWGAGYQVFSRNS